MIYFRESVVWFISIVLRVFLVYRGYALDVFRAAEIASRTRIAWPWWISGLCSVWLCWAE
jgi:hypothetical protein